MNELKFWESKSKEYCRDGWEMRGEKEKVGYKRKDVRRALLCTAFASIILRNPPAMKYSSIQDSRWFE
jgi:hypothetical protein